MIKKHMLNKSIYEAFEAFESPPPVFFDEKNTHNKIGRVKWRPWRGGEKNLNLGQPGEEGC